jgi:fatty-acyl-CoA synthase
LADVNFLRDSSEKQTTQLDSTRRAPPDSEEIQSLVMIKELCGENEVIWNRWYKNAERTPDRDAITHWVGGEEPFRLTFSALITTAEDLTAMLVERDIGKGDICAIIMRHNRILYPLYLAVVCVGAIPAILAYPNPRLHPDKFRQGIEGMSLRSGLDWVFTERDLEKTICPSLEKPESTIKGLYFPLEWKTQHALAKEQLDRVITRQNLVNRDDPLLLQHSSGTTGLQKPVLLSHRAVLEHVKYYGQAIGLNDNDKIVSWLPLYHDMGLIAAFHLPLAFGISTVQIDPFEWVLVPSLLLEAVSSEGGTISWLPNFAYNMMADKIADDELDGINLDSWRLVINCSEPVRHESHQKFVRRFQQYGLNPLAISSCYAMAETTFAATQTPPGAKPTLLSLDRIELAKGKVKIAQKEGSARICVSSGRTIAGCVVRIVDEDHRDAHEGTVGEIAIRSISMFDGYRNYPEKTAEVLSDGWYYSGDYGFSDRGDYYVIGRKKDIIIVAGNNIYPEDVEDVVGKVEGVIPGRVVAFGEEDRELGSERVSVIAETKIGDEQRTRKLKMDVIEAAMTIDVSITSVYLVPPRWLIKSSAGKPSRKANKERILSSSETRGSKTNDYAGIEAGHTNGAQVG